MLLIEQLMKLKPLTQLKQKQNRKKMQQLRAKKIMIKFMLKVKQLLRKALLVLMMGMMKLHKSKLYPKSHLMKNQPKNSANRKTVQYT